MVCNADEDIDKSIYPCKTVDMITYPCPNFNGGLINWSIRRWTYDIGEYLCTTSLREDNCVSIP